MLHHFLFILNYLFFQWVGWFLGIKTRVIFVLAKGPIAGQFPQSSISNHTLDNYLKVTHLR